MHPVELNSPSDRLVLRNALIPYRCTTIPVRTNLGIIVDVEHRFSIVRMETIRKLITIDTALLAKLYGINTYILSVRTLLYTAAPVLKKGYRLVPLHGTIVKYPLNSPNVKIEDWLIDIGVHQPYCCQGYSSALYLL